jgi:hypothetical protein
LVGLSDVFDRIRGGLRCSDSQQWKCPSNKLSDVFKAAGVSFDATSLDLSANFFKMNDIAT